MTKQPTPTDEIRAAAVLIGRLGGQVRSPAKTKASRANGKKGGRPRKAKEQSR